MKKEFDKNDYPRHLSRGITFLHRQKVKFMNDKLRDLDLVGAMYMILMHVARNPGTSQDGIVNHLHIDKCTIARRTKKLEEYGYIYRETNENDRRQNNLYPTDKGLATVPIIKEYLSEWATNISSDFSEEEMNTLIHLLHKLIDGCKDNELK